MTPLQVTRVAGFGKKPPQSFSQSPVVLGTAAGCAVRFDAAWDKGVAAQHVKIEWINNYWSLSDLGTPAGTWIDGRKLSQAYPVTGPVEFELGKGGPRCRVEPLATPAGQPATAPALTYANAPTQRTAPIPQQRRPSSGVSPALVAVIAGVAVIILAGAAYYFLDYREKHKPLDAAGAQKVVLPPGPGENPVNPPSPTPNPGPNPNPSPTPGPQPEPVTNNPLEPSVLPDDDSGQSGVTRTMGLVAHSAEQQAWSRQHFPSAASVKLNQIGVERMRSNSYAVEGPAAPLGDEIVTRKPGSSTYANESGSDDVTPSKLPVAVDNSTRSTFPGVGDQMALNSCVSFSSVYYACANNLAVARGLNAPVRLSPLWVFTMINNGENTGSNLENAYLLLQNHGAPPMEMMPYPTPQTDPGANTANPPPKYFRPWSTDPAVWRAALHNRIGAIGTFDDLDTPAGLQRLKAYLANGYLANYSTDIADEDPKQVPHDGWNANWAVAKSNSALSAEGNAAAGQPVLLCAGACDGGHAMTIVGYNDDVWVDYNNDGIVQPQEKGALKVVNSWGKDGFPRKRDGGFAWISYDALRDHSQFPWIEAKNRVPVIEDKQAWYMLPDKEEEKSPVLAQFTLANAHRNEIDVRLGISSLSAKDPEYTWRPAMLTVSDFPSKYRLSQDTAMGGPFAFDGGDQEIDGTFVFDLMTLVHNFGSPKGFRLYLIVNDLKSGNPTTVKDFCITDPDGKILARCGLAQPVSIDKNTATLSIDVQP